MTHKVNFIEKLSGKTRTAFFLVDKDERTEDACINAIVEMYYYRLLRKCKDEENVIEYIKKVRPDVIPLLSGNAEGPTDYKKILFPREFIENSITIIKVVAVNIMCDGCVAGDLGQDSHRSCPYGCLHDKTCCSMCI